MQLDFAQWATSVTANDGRGYHPAIQSTRSIHYWENIICVTEQEAYERACMALADALSRANELAREWNVVKL